MHSFKVLSVLAVAASTVLAAPVKDSSSVEKRWRWNGNWQGESTTVTVTYGWPASVTALPDSGSSSGWSNAASSSAPASTSAASISSGGDWFDIANKWRTAGGQAAFTEDSTLVANALKTAQDSGGNLVHELNPGTMAQVLAPGDSSDFESVYVGGWLCEIPTLAGLNGICSSAAQGWNHAGQTGHAEILTGSYTKIGCALASGIWACDLA